MPVDSTDLRTFPDQHKTVTAYLDLATNTHGAEKGFLVHRALTRLQSGRPSVVEVGPRPTRTPSTAGGHIGLRWELWASLGSVVRWAVANPDKDPLISEPFHRG